jgi:4-diphosphocytidyl-2-C-methyl-D-erythritol kinase
LLDKHFDWELQGSSIHMSLSPLILKAPAKINLWLRIVGKRSDGYHEVETRMCPISICDSVHVARRGDTEVTLTCSDSTVPTDESNLALKALRAFESRIGQRQGWDIRLDKAIPHGAGLGGGSSNAAALLDAVNQLSGSPLSLEQLVGVASQIGSDVPFFLHRSCCDATGRGEAVTPVDFPWRLPLVLIKPPFGIPTDWAYRRWADSQRCRGVLYAAQQCPWGQMVNDLERPVYEKYALLPTLKNWLLDQAETRAALMSGSGSTMYAIAENAVGADLLARKARQLCGDGAWIQVAQTL